MASTGHSAPRGTYQRPTLTVLGTMTQLTGSPVCSVQDHKKSCET